MTSFGMLTFKEVPPIFWVTLTGGAKLRSRMQVKLGCMEGKFVVHKEYQLALVIAEERV